MSEITPELVELCGIHAGDGYLRDDGKRRELDISGSLEEIDYYDSHVCNLFKKALNIKVQPRKFNSRNTYGVVIRNREVIKLFHDLGFPYGAKSSIVRVPRIILFNKNKIFHALFLRGLFDTDGHLGFRRYYGADYIPFKVKYPTYPTIALTTVSKGLSDDIRILLFSLGLSFNYYFYRPKRRESLDSHKITVNGVPRLIQWMNIIGTKNNSKLSRYDIWKKFGFCPTNTTFKQRKDILNDIINPYLLGL